MESIYPSASASHLDKFWPGNRQWRMQFAGGRKSFARRVCSYNWRRSAAVEQRQRVELFSVSLFPLMSGTQFSPRGVGWKTIHRHVGRLQLILCTSLDLHFQVWVEHHPKTLTLIDSILWTLCYFVWYMVVERLPRFLVVAVVTSIKSTANTYVRGEQSLTEFSSLQLFPLPFVFQTKIIDFVASHWPSPIDRTLQIFLFFLYALWQIMDWTTLHDDRRDSFSHEWKGRSF